MCPKGQEFDHSKRVGRFTASIEGIITGMQEARGPTFWHAPHTLEDGNYPTKTKLPKRTPF